MISLVKIYQGELNNQGHKSFEWLNKDYKKLKGIFCSPGVNLSLAFNSGKKLMFRGFEQGDAIHQSPNDRIIKVSENLGKEIIIGVINKTEPTSSDNAAVYLILER